MTCNDCGHERCDGRECKDPRFVLPNGTFDCAICCREQVARAFEMLALLSTA